MRKDPEELIRDEVRALTAYHVPDATGMVKLDAMENPYPLPDELRAEVGALVAGADVNRYPDASCAALKGRLRSVLGVPDTMSLVLGNGSDEIIQMLMLATARPGSVVLGVEPSFVMFRLIAAFCGMRYVACCGVMRWTSPVFRSKRTRWMLSRLVPVTRMKRA